MGAGVDALIKSMNKDMKCEFISKGTPAYDYERIPFTSPRLNYITYGGLPIGKLIEFYGENHGGKTTLALDIVANYQLLVHRNSNLPKGVVYADIENTLDPVWATKLGVNLESPDYYQINPSSQGAETIFEQITQLMDTGEIGLVVIDSLGAMESNDEFDNSIEDKTYGGISLALTKFSKKAEQFCHKYHCTVIGINQEREKMNSPYGGKKTTGGEAWKFHCSVRMEFRMGKFFDSKGNELTREAENPVGNYILVKMIKNKTCPPTRRTGYCTVNYYIGIDYLRDLVEVALKCGIIIQSGAWFSIVNPETGEQVNKVQGQAKVYEYLGDENNEETLKDIEDYINKQIQED